MIRLIALVVAAWIVTGGSVVVVDAVLAQPMSGEPSTLVKALKNFREQEDDAWRLELDRYGHVRRLHGGEATATGGSLVAFAKRFVRKHEGLFGLSGAHLELFELGSRLESGDDDLDVVSLGVQYRGLELLGARIDARFDGRRRRLLALSATTFPVHLAEVTPRLSAARVREIVARAHRRGEIKGEPRLAVHASAGGRLVYVVTIEEPAPRASSAEPTITVEVRDANSGVEVR